MKIKTKNLILCALFAALTAVCSQIALVLPITQVPFNLATFAVFLAGGLLGASTGAISQIVYVFLGAIGVPVFAQFSGGFQNLIGPTGGYIIGYIAGAWVTGLLVNQFSKRSFFLYALAMAAGLAACYALGTAWYMVLTKANLTASLMLCVVPFLPVDALKIVLAAFLCTRLSKHLKHT
ncbi:MAG TPA: biotin transporter BioY [Firmicutes bacterium]|nr:biotin transporter BioY [Bacillota bacterium]